MKRKQRVKVKRSNEATTTTIAGDQNPVNAVINPRLKPKTQQKHRSTSSSSSLVLNTNSLNKPLSTKMMMTLSPDFFRIDALELAPRLLGKYLRKDDVVLQITEVEAYRSSDSACHGRFGITPRTAPMFGPGGHAYVYLCYGLHNMLNIVADKEGVGAAVLVRSCAPVSGLEIIQQRRGLKTLKPVLLTGPGKIGQALGISTEWSNHPLFEPGGLELLDGPEPEKILIGPRVGIDYALPEHVNALWRFAIAGISFPRPFKVLAEAVFLQQVEVPSIHGTATTKERQTEGSCDSGVDREARRLSKQRRNSQQRGGNDLAGPSRSDAAQLPVMPVTRLGSALETPRQRTYIDRKKGEFAASNTLLDIGQQDQTCGYCGALVWAADMFGKLFK